MFAQYYVKVHKLDLYFISFSSQQRTSIWYSNWNQLYTQLENLQE